MHIIGDSTSQKPNENHAARYNMKTGKINIIKLQTSSNLENKVDAS